MQFEALLEEVGNLPLFRGSLLLAGDRDPADVRRQLSRWTTAGKVVQLRRDVYVLADPWRRVDPHPFLVANELNRPSYVSLQSARGSRRVVRGNALRARGPVGKAEARTCRPSAAGTAGYQNELLPPALEKRRPAPAPPLPGGRAQANSLARPAA